MAKNDIGVDWAKYRGDNGVYPSVPIKFVIAQVGGITGGALYDQAPYTSQVRTALAKGMHVHTYIWYEVGQDQGLAQKVLDYHLPKIAPAKGTIVALDYEAGASSNKAGNTDAILYGMRRIKEAGFTPMYYSYKPYTVDNVDYQRIIKEFPNSLWIASYASTLMTAPDFNYFPSMDGIAIWQFTDGLTIRAGLDGNVDLTGITDSGYGGSTNTGGGSTSLPDASINYTPNMEDKEMTYLIFAKDTKRWYVTNGIEIRYVRTTRVLGTYQDQWLKFKLPVDTMFQAEVDKEFGTGATSVGRDVSKG